jgi:hypothetical protein
MAGQLDSARRARKVLKTIVVLALWGLITHGTHAGTGDEPHYLAIAHSIAFDGDVDLANNYGADEPLIAGGALKPEAHVRPGVDEVARPVHDIGLPLTFAPYVRLAVPLTLALTRIIPTAAMERARLNPSVLYRHLLSFAMIGLTMVLAGWLFDACLQLGASTRTALGTSLLVILSPPLLIFSALFFTELLSALLAFFVFRQVCLLEARGIERWAMAGAVTGFLFLVHARNIGLVVPLAVLALLNARDPARRADAMAFAAGLALLLGVRTAVNYHFWGTLIAGPHARLSEWPGLSSLVAESATRLAGLAIDQEFGLLTYAPLYLLGIAGLVPLYRVRRDLAIAVAAIVIVYVGFIVCPITNVHGWTGGWSPAARFLTPIVPMLALLLVPAMRALPRVLVATVLVLQIAIDAYAWQRPKILWNDGNGEAAFCENSRSGVCRYLPSLR